MANVFTRSSSEKLDELAQVITRFQDHFNLRMDEVTNRVESLERRSTTPEPINLRHDNDSDHTPRHILKLDVPRFQGVDPHGWIFKITQFFTYHHTPEHERITVASFYLVPMDVQQWVYHFVATVSARFGTPFCAYSIRRPTR
jgi:hypothetical protein